MEFYKLFWDGGILACCATVNIKQCITNELHTVIAKEMLHTVFIEPLVTKILHHGNITHVLQLAKHCICSQYYYTPAQTVSPTYLQNSPLPNHYLRYWILQHQTRHMYENIQWIMRGISIIYKIKKHFHLFFFVISDLWYRDDSKV